VLDHATDEDVIVTLDADTPSARPDSHAGEQLDDGYDVAIASATGRAPRCTASRYVARCRTSGAWCSRLYPIPGVRDYTCCFRAYRAPMLKRARLAYGDELCTARGFEAVMDLLLRLGPLGVRATEIGFVLDYGERVGQSKMKVLRTIGQTLRLLTRRRIESMTRYRPGQVRALLADAERREARAPS
jgi:dolichol-phosphate mannosyltransferase